MYLLKPIFLTTFLCILFKIIIAQGIHQGVEKVYGMDPDLYNGQIYDYFVQVNSRGNQFLSRPEFTEGSVRIKGVTYTDLLLNYDVFNQQLLLKGHNALYSNTIIALSQAWLEGFSLGPTSFEVVRFQDTSRRICQISGDSYIRILTYWTKEQKIDYYYTTPIYVFSLPEKQMYLQIGTDIIRFKNNKSFISAFGKPLQVVISKYMHQHKVKVRKADTAKIQALIIFCNTLPR